MSPADEGPPSAEPAPDTPDPTGPPAPKPPTMGDFFFVGTACAVSVVGAGAVGYLLDSWLGLTPWLTFAGLIFGITAAVLLAYSNFRKFV
jgi:hypothetical protein